MKYNLRTRSSPLDGVQPVGITLAEMTINLLLESKDQAVIWRGPLISGAIRQFWADVRHMQSVPRMNLAAGILRLLNPERSAAQSKERRMQ